MDLAVSDLSPRNSDPWKKVREPSAGSDKFSRDFLSFQSQNIPNCNLEGVDEIRSHYWGHGQKSIIRSKFFTPMKNGLNWKLSPRELNPLTLGFRSVPLIGFQSECAHGVQEHERPIPDTTVPPRRSTSTPCDALALSHWARPPDKPVSHPLRDRERAKVRARPSKPTLYGGTLLLGALVEQEVLAHSPRFAAAAAPAPGRPPGPLIPGFGCLRFREDWHGAGLVPGWRDPAHGGRDSDRIQAGRGRPITCQPTVRGAAGSLTGRPDSDAAVGLVEVRRALGPGVFFFAAFDSEAAPSAAATEHGSHTAFGCERQAFAFRAQF